MFFFILSSILFLAFLFKWFCYNHSKILPPSPWKLPIIGNMHQLGMYPHRSLQNLSEKHGHLMRIQLGNIPGLVVSSANAAQEILKNNDLVFANRPKNYIHDKIIYGSKDVAFSRYGEFWRQVRSICVLHMLSNTSVQSFYPVREEETWLMVRKIRGLCSDSSTPSLINLSDILRSFSSDVFCRIALGKKYTDDDTGKKFKFLLKESVGLLGEFNVGSYIPWLRWVNRFNGLDKRADRVAKEFDEFLQSVVEEHISESKGGEAKTTDFVDILLEFQREDKAGFSIQTDTVKALIIDMFVGGSDTTFALLEWSITELLRNPKTLKKLQDEVRQIAQGKSCITEDDVPKMQYVKAVIKESLRLHPPIPLIPREAIHDSRVVGYDITAKTQVLVNAWALGRDPLLWENPEEFEPERFFRTNIDFKGFNFEFIPFGSGRRGCPGSQFSLAVNEVALANLVLNFNFALPDRPNTNDMDIVESAGLAVHKKYPLVVTVTPCFL